MAETKHTPGQMYAVRDALASALGNTYDCTRVWEAWRIGTMSQYDFVPVNEDDDRMHELTVAALDASGVAELIEALQTLLAYGLKMSARHEAPAFAMARAALAKATGAA